MLSNNFGFNQIPAVLSACSARTVNVILGNYPAKNKKHTVIRICMVLVETRFKNVEYVYTIRWLSFLPCDRDFGKAKIAA